MLESWFSPALLWLGIGIVPFLLIVTLVVVVLKD